MWVVVSRHQGLLVGDFQRIPPALPDCFPIEGQRGLAKRLMMNGMPRSLS